MAHCEDYIELISAGLDGALSPAEAEALNAHLAQCPDCRALYDDLAALHAGLAELPFAEPPAELPERIMAAVSAEKVVPLPTKKNLQWKKWMASAAVLALVVAGTWSWNANRSEGAGSAMPPATGSERSDAARSGEEAAPAEVPSTGHAETAVTGYGGPVSRKAADVSAPQEPAPASLPAVDNSGEPAVLSDAPSIPAPAAPITPRLFSAPPPPANNTGELTEETQNDLAAQEPSAVDETCAPASFALTTAYVEDTPAPAQTPVLLTADQAVQALANYIYEFVEEVAPAALEESEQPSWYLSSPTGVSGTAVLEEETEALFSFSYQDDEGGQCLRYTVDKADATVLFLPQEPLD